MVFLTAGAGGAGGSLILVLVMFGVLYAVMILPDKKKRKAADQMRKSLSVGDEIVTIGGICGTVCNVKEDRITMESGADQVRIEVMKWAVGTNETADKAAKEAAKKAAIEKQRLKDEKKKAKNK